LIKISDEIQKELVNDFKPLIKYYACNSPFGMDSYRNHFKTIKMRKALSNAHEIDVRYLKQVHATLETWGLKNRGAIIINGDKFINKFTKNKISHILDKFWNDKLEKYQEEDEINIIIDELAEVVYDKFPIMENRNGGKSKSQLVGGSKFLHHLLPDLVPPMDRYYTMQYFYGNTNTSKNKFMEVFKAIWEISVALNKRYKLGKYLFNDFRIKYISVYYERPKYKFKPISISVPKLIDDIIISHRMKNGKNKKSL